MKKEKVEKPMAEEVDQVQAATEQKETPIAEAENVEAYKQSAKVAALKMMEALRQCETLTTALAEAQQGAQMYRDQLLRQKAEFDNYRKRTTGELATARDEGAMETLRLLLPTLDNLDRALSVAREDGSESVAKGLEMVFAGLMASFEKKGLQEMEAEGKPFDPNVHNAVMQESCEDETIKDTVAQVLQKGYLYKGQVLRYATVKVYV